ncbi:hypothetical protein KJ691_00975 [bacterium]|nr:hypothetical protein [bacterium]
MKFILLFLPILLWAKAPYPFIFNSLSDTLYTHLDGYKELLTLPYFKENCIKLQNHAKELELLKAEGYTLDADPKSSDINLYAKSLRSQKNKIKKTNHTIAHELTKLLKNKQYKILILLRDNPLDFIRTSQAVSFSVQAYQAPSPHNIDTLKQVALEGSLGILKEKLLFSRGKDKGLALCLNDIAAINYLMLQIDAMHSAKEYCKSLEYVRKLIEHSTASRNTCQYNSSYYELWDERSGPYRENTLKDLTTLCLE